MRIAGCVVSCVVLAACGRIDFSAPGATGFAYRKPLAVAATSVAGGADLAGFPLLVAISDGDLRPQADGGKLATGVDFAFVAGDGVTPLPFQIDELALQTGDLLAWVMVPVLSATIGASFELDFGDPSLTTSQQDPTSVWTASFAGVWHLDDPTYDGFAGECADATGANPGTGSAVTPGAIGKIGRAASFTTMCSEIAVPASPSLQPASVTVSAWAQPTDLGVGSDRIDTILAQDYWRATGTSSQGYYIEIFRTVSQPTPDFYAANGPTYAQAFASTSLTSSQWSYIVGTYNAASGEARTYVDGVLQGTATMTGAIQYLSKPVNIGCSPVTGQGPNGWWNGVLDEVRVASVVRTPGWIATEYANQNDPAAFVTVGATEPR